VLKVISRSTFIKKKSAGAAVQSSGWIRPAARLRLARE